MVVNDFDVPRVVVPPAKADSPLVVDPDVLTAPIAADFLEPVARRHAKVVQVLGAIEHLRRVATSTMDSHNRNRGFLENP